jgi:hypothetical protein
VWAPHGAAPAYVCSPVGGRRYYMVFVPGGLGGGGGLVRWVAHRNHLPQPPRTTPTFPTRTNPYHPCAAQLLSQLHHVNIIGYHAYFVHDDHLNIVLEYAAGGDLAMQIKAAKDAGLECVPRHPCPPPPSSPPRSA